MEAKIGPVGLVDSGDPHRRKEQANEPREKKGASYNQGIFRGRRLGFGLEK